MNDKNNKKSNADVLCFCDGDICTLFTLCIFDTFVFLFCLFLSQHYVLPRLHQVSWRNFEPQLSLILILSLLLITELGN